jgi:hypothetical protein
MRATSGRQAAVGWRASRVSRSRVPEAEREHAERSADAVHRDGADRIIHLQPAIDEPDFHLGHGHLDFAGSFAPVRAK